MLSPDLLRDYAALFNDSVSQELDLGLMTLIGSDSATWLQGQVTQDVRSVDESGAHTGFCDPKGRLLATFRLWKTAGGYYVSGSHEHLNLLKQRVERTVILEDVALSAVSQSCLSVQGPKAEGSGLALPHSRFGMKGFDCWEVDFRGTQTGVFGFAETLFGTPSFHHEIDGTTFIPELGPRFEREHISWNKGCYVGQEVLMRLHSRGHTNRQLMLWRADSLPDQQKGFKVTRSVQHPEGGVAGLAWVHAKLLEIPLNGVELSSID